MDILSFWAKVFHMYLNLKIKYVQYAYFITLLLNYGWNNKGAINFASQWSTHIHAYTERAKNVPF